MAKAATPPPISVPSKKELVWNLLKAAGHDVSAWSVGRDQKPIEKPWNNPGRNTNWTFPGNDSEPVVLCVWYEQIDTAERYPLFARKHKPEPAKLARTIKESRSDRAATKRQKQLQAMDRAIADAYRRARPIRVILVVPQKNRRPKAKGSTRTVKARSLDPAVWYVDSYNPIKGHFRIVRGKSAPSIVERKRAQSKEIIRFLSNSSVDQLSETERDAIVKLRIGQGAFKDELRQRWNGCSVTGCSHASVLVASHIKPWSQCTKAADRLNVANGLLLTPALDRLFDRGQITFDDQFKIVISSRIPKETLAILHVDATMMLNGKFEDIRAFLAWHRKYRFEK